MPNQISMEPESGTISSDDLTTRFTEKLRCRMEELRKQLLSQHAEVFTDQKHTIEGSVERTYWHYGYMVALRDILRLIEGDATL